MKRFIEYCINSLIDINTNVSAHKVSSNIVTVPNLITSGGILMTGFYFLQFYYTIATWFIPINILLIGISDILDGYLATLLNQHSWLGKWLDGARDRFTGAMVLWNMIIVHSSTIICMLIVSLVILEVTNAFFLAQKAIKAIESNKTVNVYRVSKARQLLHVTCGLIFVVQEYWLPSAVVSVEFLLTLMIIGSFANVMALLKEIAL